MIRRRAWTAIAAIGVGLGPGALGVAADELRNVKIGQPVPDFSVSTLNGDTLSLASLRGRVVVLVYLSADQRSSELALADIGAIERARPRGDLALVGVSADVVDVAYFRQLRDRLNVHHPFGLDVGRRIYGDLGLLVTPTTIVIDREGRLARVISSRRSDYPLVLDAYVEHALGEIDDEELERRLHPKESPGDAVSERVARHRAAARVLRQRGLLRDAERELVIAIEADPEHADAALDLAAVYIAMGRHDEAGPLVERAVAIGTSPRRAMMMRGIVHYHAGQLDEAKTLLDEALLLNPNPVWTHYYLGRIAEDRGDDAAAALHFRESLDRMLPDYPI